MRYARMCSLIPHAHTGAKGLSMNAAQWAALVAGAPGFNAALQSQE